MIAAAIVVPAALFAWGPSRQTFTIEQPSDHVAFNSITNNPDIGDERNFVGIREAGTNNLWTDNMTVQNGKEYTVRMYVHNNAAANLTLVAENVTAKFNLPTNTAKSIQVNGFLSASNVGANKQGNTGSYAEVYDHATFNSDKNFNVAYQAGSLKFENNAFGAAGTAIPESVFTSAGAKLGYDKLDGKIPGCFQFDGYLSFKVKAQVAQTVNFTNEKQVRKAGSTSWSKTIDAKAGDDLEYLITYKNIGEAAQDNVTLKDTLPNGINYVPGSTLVANTTNPSGLKVSDNIVKPSGVNIGNYNGGAAAYVKFSAKVANNDKLPVCGPNNLRNTARIETAHGWKESTADVKVNKDCIPPKDIKVCDLASKKIITIKEDQFDANKHSKNLKDCEVKPGKITVCELASKKIITIDENKFDASKHSKNMKDCEVTPVVPVTPAELPKTGAGDGVTAALALGALVASASYYIASRRLLGN
jgi:uncharacterized repeat protein (TIGR01451 family)/LPXTG-motif cell wall-anchored protein